MKKFIILLLILPLLSFSVHKYYISLTEIDYKPETKSVQIIMNVFIDDIENAINKEYNVDLQLVSKKELKNSDTLFFKYLEKHFKLKINQKEVHYNFIGKEYDGDIVFFYLEIENIADFKTIEIQNNVLMRHFSEQQNLIKASVNKERKSLFLTKKKDTDILNF
ncbi:DUF6702 family protein [Tenacibaculum piscium]|uniref:Peptidase E n=1 Tax=Tenacibaculum piscium TaxID=1458515 RepID=A0A2H1YGK9_9FLAO|nr:DUF6702 family protein [Tenacibaculum piscium]MBE7630320.1 hypothetical protein [Tenacibaculum piscium]MBE7670821.1 hypothetical protein [Tenacibaculum piscium]MBE7690348.1 hypothetical protein [Tenacibaculum piscium]SOS74619.1 conserved hypothetical protein [Tenacibaculum piscium]